MCTYRYGHHNGDEIGSEARRQLGVGTANREFCSRRDQPNRGGLRVVASGEGGARQQAGHTRESGVCVYGTVEEEKVGAST